ncbi:MAG: hypothetical protein COS65_29855 [Armatimonadetes bacterium CG06_land_8_20_14_3_00_66_21]|nr:MAG: hypothetical protein COS65_29855 [Armatimonadetes bacterium CG06_land_8_20_14_3_00_66_21]
MKQYELYIVNTDCGCCTPSSPAIWMGRRQGLVSSDCRPILLRAPAPHVPSREGRRRRVANKQGVAPLRRTKALPPVACCLGATWLRRGGARNTLPERHRQTSDKSKGAFRMKVTSHAVLALALSACGLWAEEEGAPKPGDKQVNPKDGAELVWIPGGEFQMGSDPAERDRLWAKTGWDAYWKKYAADESPKHGVKVAGFWMYAKEVTNGQYRKFLAANPQWTPERIDSKLHDGDYLEHWKEQSRASKDESYPVANVPWYAAKAYAEWAGGRLPTEAEWEYAARGGKQFEYGTATGEISDQLANSGGGGTKPVGSYRPNPFGLYDLAGNVWEWCSSLYKEYPYRANDGREDPNGSGARVLRGGSFDGSGPALRAADRTLNNPSSCGFCNGFRVVVPAGVP